MKHFIIHCRPILSIALATLVAAIAILPTVPIVVCLRQAHVCISGTSAADNSLSIQAVEEYGVAGHHPHDHHHDESETVREAEHGGCLDLVIESTVELARSFQLHHILALPLVAIPPIWHEQLRVTTELPRWVPQTGARPTWLQQARSIQIRC